MVFSATASDPTGHEIQSLALSVQVMIDPARRGYDPTTRERLAELFGPPASWTPSHPGARLGAGGGGGPGFTGYDHVRARGALHLRPRGRGDKYFYALKDGEVPLSFHFNGTVFYLAAATAGYRSRRCRGAPRPSSGCRSRPGGR